MATEMIWSLKNTAGDYGAGQIPTWIADTSVLLTSTAATRVFTHGGITGSLGDGSAVTGVTSGATGTVVGVVTSTQIMIDGIGATPFEAGGEQIQVDASNHVTSTDGGDSAIAVLECYSDFGSGYDVTATINVTGATANSTNYRVIRAATGEAHDGADPTTGFYLTTNASMASHIFRLDENSARAEYLACINPETTTNQRFTFQLLDGTTTLLGCLAKQTSASGGTQLRAFGGSGEILACHAIDYIFGFFIGNFEDVDVYNCVAKDCTTGFDSVGASTTYDFRNCIAYGGTTRYNVSTGTDGGSTTNGADDATPNTPPGTSPITTNLVSGDFVDVSLDNMQPQDTGTAHEAGTSLTGVFTTGILGNTFAATWNIGAWALSSGANDAPVLIKNMKQQV